MAAHKVLIVASALLVQVAFGQVFGNSVLTNQINLGSSGNNIANSGISVANGGLSTVGVANTGLSGIGYGNAGLIGGNVGLAGAGLGGLSTVGVANTGFSSGYNVANSGIAVANGGLSTVGVANTGLSGIGLGSAGLIGGSVGLVGAGLNSASLLAIPDVVNIRSSGPLTVSSISPIGPSGLAVASENEIVGILTVTGGLPFLSAVAFEGAFPTAGSGVATCGCGNGAVGILSEGFPAVAPGPVFGIGSGIGGMYY